MYKNVGKGARSPNCNDGFSSVGHSYSHMLHDMLLSLIWPNNKSNKYAQPRDISRRDKGSECIHLELCSMMRLKMLLNGSPFDSERQKVNKTKKKCMTKLEKEITLTLGVKVQFIYGCRLPLFGRYLIRSKSCITM